MTYNELYKLVKNLKIDQASCRNHERLKRHGLCDGMEWEFRGSNGKRYSVGVFASRGYIGIQSKHRLSTLEKWCGESVGHITDL